MFSFRKFIKLNNEDECKFLYVGDTSIKTLKKKSGAVRMQFRLPGFSGDLATVDGCQVRLQLAPPHPDRVTQLDHWPALAGISV